MCANVMRMSMRRALKQNVSTKWGTKLEHKEAKDEMKEILYAATSKNKT